MKKKTICVRSRLKNKDDTNSRYEVSFSGDVISVDIPKTDRNGNFGTFNFSTTLAEALWDGEGLSFQVTIEKVGCRTIHPQKILPQKINSQTVVPQAVVSQTVSLGQLPLGQPLLGQVPLGQPPMGPPPLGQSAMGQPPIGQPPLGQFFPYQFFPRQYPWYNSFP